MIMARVLRSRTKDTNIPASSEKYALEPVPRSLSDRLRLPLTSSHLDDYKENVPVTVDEVEVDQELKTLKAMYKSALGVKKKKKSRKAKEKPGFSDDKDSSIASMPIPVTDESIDQSFVVIQHHIATSEPMSRCESQGKTSLAQLQQLSHVQYLQTAYSSTSATQEIIIRVLAPIIPKQQVSNCPDQAEEEHTLQDTKSQSTKSDQAAQSLPDRSTKDIHSAHLIRAIVEHEVHLQETINEHEDDSFVDQILSRSPSKFQPRSKIMEEEDSFVEHIVSRSPAKLVASPAYYTNIQDRMAMETDAIELTSESDAFGFQSPRPREGTLSVSKSTVTTISATKEKVSSKPATDTPKQSIKSLFPPKERVRSTKAITRPSFKLPGEAVAARLKERRAARLTEAFDDKIRAGGSVGSTKLNKMTSTLGRPPRVRSSRPAIKPSFALPDDVFSQRKREVHEARLKVQEEEQRKRRNFEAKPVRKSIASLSCGVAGIGAHRSVAGSKSRQEDRSPLPNAIRPGQLGGIHCPHLLFTGVPTSPSRQGIARWNNSFSTMITASASTSPTTTRAKEMYSKDTRPSVSVEAEKRERETRARQTREEAAKQGRESSSLWAEKNKVEKGWVKPGNI